MDRLIGNEISEARHKKGLTQDELSKLTGISRSYICDVENGRYNPSLKLMTKLAGALDIDLNFLLEMTEIQCAPKASGE